MTPNDLEIDLVMSDPRGCLRSPKPPNFLFLHNIIRQFDISELLIFDLKVRCFIPDLRLVAHSKGLDNEAAWVDMGTETHRAGKG